MANYSVLKAAVQAVVKTNGNQEITGANMQSTLISIINSLGTGYQFMGVATPSTSPGIPDQREFYITGEAGTYTNFNSLVVTGIAVLYYDTAWHVTNVAGIDDVPTAGSNNLVKSGGVYSELDPLGRKVDEKLDAVPEENTEYIRAITDSQRKVLEAVKRDGTKVLYTDVEMLGQSIKGIIEDYLGNFKDTVTMGLSETTDYLWVIKDSENHIFAYIDREGKFAWTKGIPENLSKEIDRKVLDLYGNLVKAALFNSSANNGAFLGMHNVLVPYINNQQDSIRLSLDNGNVGCIIVMYEGDTDYRKRTCEVIKYANENDIPVYVSLYGFPQWNDNIVKYTHTMEQWDAALAWMATLDGNTPHALPNGTTYPCKMYAAKFCDELPSNYQNYNATPTDCLGVLDYSANYIKERLPGVHILSSSLNSYVKDYFDEILATVLPNEHRFCDTFDILFFDRYSSPESMMEDIFAIYYELIRKQPEIGNYEVIYTNGYSSATYSDDEQGALVLRSCLISVAEGAKHYIPFTYERYPGPIRKDPMSYYVLNYDFEGATHLSIFSLSNGVSSGKDICYPGDLCSNIPLRCGTYYNADYIEIGKDLVTTLKNGFAISTDKPCHILRISGYDGNNTEQPGAVLFSGDAVSPLVISTATASALNGNTEKVRIVFNTEGIATSDVLLWKPRKALQKLFYLQRIVPESSPRIKITIYENLYIASWNDEKGRPVYALWRIGEQKNKITINGAYYATNSVGDYIMTAAENSVSRDPIFVFNATGIIVM